MTEKESIIANMSSTTKYRKALTQTLRALRGTRTQREIAEAAEVPISTWCKIEQGRHIPREPTYARIAAVFGLTASELDERVSAVVLSDYSMSALDPATELPRSVSAHLRSILDGIVAARHGLDALEEDVKTLALEARQMRGS